MAQIIPLARRDLPMTEGESVDARLARVETRVEAIENRVENLEDTLNERMTQLETMQGAHHTENTTRLSSIQSTLDFQEGERAANQRTKAWVGRGLIAAVSTAFGGAVTYFFGGHH